MLRPYENIVNRSSMLAEKEVLTLPKNRWSYDFDTLFFGGGAADLACCDNWAKAPASSTAISAKTLRSSDTPAAFRP